MEIAFISALTCGTVTYPYNETVDRIMLQILEGMKEIRNRVERIDAPTGIYLATLNSGIRPSIAYWKSALELGPGFVFPQAFPGTLANFPAAELARALKIRGPNHTLVGGVEALLAAFDHALYDLHSDYIGRALLIGIDFDLPAEGRVSYGAILLDKINGPYPLHRLKNGDPSPTPAGISPSEMIKEICSCHDHQKDLIFGTRNEGYYGIFFSGNG
jgi:hypothetical protein